jgi:hypothetical protein
MIGIDSIVRPYITGRREEAIGVRFRSS